MSQEILSFTAAVPLSGTGNTAGNPSSLNKTAIAGKAGHAAAAYVCITEVFLAKFQSNILKLSRPSLQVATNTGEMAIRK